MWLDNLKELKKAKGMSLKQIADVTNLPERTVTRIFSGDTDNPYVDTLHRIVSVLDGSLDDVLADSKAVVGSKNLAALQAEVDRLSAENGLLSAEIAVLKDKAVALTAENDLLRMKLEHKEEIISLHNYYIGKSKVNE
jgi:transcriptional regulator with XRE-family HTH domain